MQRGDLVWVSFRNPKDTATLGAAVIGFLAASPRPGADLLVYVHHSAIPDGHVKTGRAYLFEKRTVFMYNHLAQECAASNVTMYGVGTHEDLHTTLRLAAEARRYARSAVRAKNYRLHISAKQIAEARLNWLQRVREASKNKNLFAFFVGAGAGYVEFMSSPVYFESESSSQTTLWRERTLWASQENSKIRLLHRQLERLWSSSTIDSEQLLLPQAFFACFQTLLPAHLALSFVQRQISVRGDKLFAASAFGILPPAHLLERTGPILAVFKGGAVLVYIDESSQELSYVNIADGKTSSTFVEAVSELYSQKRVIFSNREASSSTVPYVNTWLLFWEAEEPPRIKIGETNESDDQQKKNRRVWSRISAAAAATNLTFSLSRLMVLYFFMDPKYVAPEAMTLPFIPYAEKEVGASLFNLIYPTVKLIGGSSYTDFDDLTDPQNLNDKQVREIVDSISEWLGFKNPQEAQRLLFSVLDGTTASGDAEDEEQDSNDDDSKQKETNLLSLFKRVIDALSDLNETTSGNDDQVLIVSHYGGGSVDSQKKNQVAAAAADDTETIDTESEASDYETGSDGGFGFEFIGATSKPRDQPASPVGGVSYTLDERISIWRGLVVNTAARLNETIRFVYNDNCRPTINSLRILLSHEKIHSDYQYVLNAMLYGKVGTLPEATYKNPETEAAYAEWVRSYSTLLMLLRGMQSLIEFAALTSMDIMAFTSTEAYSRSYLFWYGDAFNSASSGDTWKHYFKHALAVRNTLVPLPFSKAGEEKSHLSSLSILSEYAPLVRIIGKLRELSSSGQSLYRSGLLSADQDLFTELSNYEHSLLETASSGGAQYSGWVRPSPNEAKGMPLFSTPKQNDNDGYSSTGSLDTHVSGEDPDEDQEDASAIEALRKALENTTFISSPLNKGAKLQLEFEQRRHQQNLARLIGAESPYSTVLRRGAPTEAARQVGIQRVQLREQAGERAKKLLQRVKSTRSQETVEPFFTTLSRRRLQYYEDVLLKNRLITTQLEVPSLAIIKQVDDPLELMRLFNGLQRRALTCAMFARLCDDVSIFYDNADSGRQQSFSARTLVQSVDFRRPAHTWGSTLFSGELGFEHTEISSLGTEEGNSKLVALLETHKLALILLPREQTYVYREASSATGAEERQLHTPWATLSFGSVVFSPSDDVLVITRSSEHRETEILEFVQSVQRSSEYLAISEKDLASGLTLGEWWFQYGGAAIADLFRRPALEKRDLVNLDLLDEAGESLNTEASSTPMRELTRSQIAVYIAQSIMNATRHIEKLKSVAEPTFVLNRIIKSVTSGLFTFSAKNIFKVELRSDANSKVPPQNAVALTYMTEPVYERDFVYLLCGYMNRQDTPQLYVLMNRSSGSEAAAAAAAATAPTLSLFSVERSSSGTATTATDPTAIISKPFDGKLALMEVSEQNAQRLLSSALFVFGYSPHRQSPAQSVDELKKRLLDVEEDCEARGKALTAGLSPDTRVLEEGLTVVEPSLRDFAGLLLSSLLFFRDGCKRTFYDEQRFRLVVDGYEGVDSSLEDIIGSVTPPGHELISKTIDPREDTISGGTAIKDLISKRPRALFHLKRAATASPPQQHYYFAAYQRISDTLYAAMSSGAEKTTVVFVDSPDKVADHLLGEWMYSERSGGINVLFDARQYTHTLRCINTARSYIYSGRAQNIRLGELLELASYKAAIHYRTPSMAAQQLWMLDELSAAAATNKKISKVSLLLVDRAQQGLLLLRRIQPGLFFDCVGSGADATSGMVVFSDQVVVEKYITQKRGDPFSSCIAWA